MQEALTIISSICGIGSFIVSIFTLNKVNNIKNSNNKIHTHFGSGNSGTNNGVFGNNNNNQQQ